jgi:hypothetical protein
VVFINRVPITTFAYIQSWIGRTNVEDIVKQTEEEFKKYGQPYKVINTTDNVYNRENWIDIGNVWGFRSFHAAIKDFDMSYDYMLYMSGDINTQGHGWNNILDRAYSVLNKYCVGCYSLEKVDSQGSKLGTNAYLEIVPDDKLLRYTSTNDLTIAFYDRETVKFLLDVFNYMETRTKLVKMRWGWGIEAAAACICIYNNKALFKDLKFIISKASSSTPFIRDEAIREEIKFLSLFFEYCESINIDMKDILEKRNISLQSFRMQGIQSVYINVPSIYR